MTSTTFFIIFIPILSIILLFVNLLLAPHNPYQEKDSTFECGFHSFRYQNRTQFSVSFFIFGLLFLLFDLEILLVYPYSVSGYNNDIYGLSIMMIFFILLTLGFIFELGKNALTIESKQTSVSNNQDIIDLWNIFFKGDLPLKSNINIKSTLMIIAGLLLIFNFDFLIEKVLVLGSISEVESSDVFIKLFSATATLRATSYPALEAEVDEYQSRIKDIPEAADMRSDANNDPEKIRENCDNLIGEFSNTREELLTKIEDERTRTDDDFDHAELDHFTRVVDVTNAASKDLIKETSNTAIDTIDDSSDTEQFMYPIEHAQNQIQEILPVFIVFEGTGLITILFALLLTCLRKSNRFWISAYYNYLKNK